MIGVGRIKAVVIGGPSVGKTALVQRIFGQDALCGPLPRSEPSAPYAAPMGPSAKSSAGPAPTVGVDFATRSVCLDAGTCPVRLHLWDASGQDRFQSLVNGYLEDLEDHDAVIIVYDISRSDTLEEARVHAQRIRRIARGEPQIALVGAKADSTSRQVTSSEGKAKAADMGAGVFAEIACFPVGNEGFSTARPPSNDVLITRSAIEQRLLRPLLRQCRDAAGPGAAQALRSAEPGVVRPRSCAEEAAERRAHRCSAQPLLRCLGLA